MRDDSSSTTNLRMVSGLCMAAHPCSPVVKPLFIELITSIDKIVVISRTVILSEWRIVTYNMILGSLYVCAGTWVDQLINPYSFDSNVTGETCIHMLGTFLKGFLYYIPWEKICNMLFQQDAVPSHFTVIVRCFLNCTFPNQRSDDRIMSNGTIGHQILLS